MEKIAMKIPQEILGNFYPQSPFLFQFLEAEQVSVGFVIYSTVKCSQDWVSFGIP